MNAFFWIVLIGLVVKIIVSYRLLKPNYPDLLEIKIELVIFFVTFTLYSVAQLLLFGSTELVGFISTARSFIVRTYYFMDAVCLFSGGFLLLSMFDVRFHKSKVSLLLVATSVIVGGYCLLFTNLFLSDEQVTIPMAVDLGGANYGEFMLIPRLLVGLILVILVLSLFRSYNNAKGNLSQAKNFYAILGCIFYAGNCFYGTYQAENLLISIRGIVFFLIVAYILKDRVQIDLRVITPTTLESVFNNRIKTILRNYANECIDLKFAMTEIEKALLEYKVQKMPKFYKKSGSKLPDIAEEMGLGLSALYALLKKHEIDYFEKKRQTNNRDKLT